MKYLVTEKTAAWIREQQAARPVQAVVGPTRKDGRMGRDVNDFERPFAICWSEAEKAWLIYFPHGSITSDGNLETLVRNDLTASTEYADGWYVLNVSAGDDWTSVYLDCWATESGSASGSRDYYAQITTSPSSHSGAIETYLVRLADIKSYSATGAKPVRQITVGALVLKGGAAQESGEAYIEAITDLEFSLIADPDNPYAKKLVVDITRKRIYGSKVEDVKLEQKNVATGIEEVSVVEKSEYSVDTHQFNNTKKKLIVLGKADDNAELVFQATPHSAEHPGGVH